MNIAGDKMFGYIDRVAGDKKPITADIFLTNYCNNSCPYCTYKRWKLPNATKAMSYEEFITYAEKMRTIGVQGFILTGGGEPTICPDFQKITNWLEERGLHYGINTNFNNLVYFKPDYLKVSLDGYDEDSYEKSRGVRKYTQVIENIKAYAAWKKEYSPKTSIGVQWVATDVEGVKKFYEANKGLDVDYFSFRPLESTGGSFYRDEARKSQAREIEAAILELAEKDDRVTLNFKWNMLDRQESRCTAQWAQIAINERGEVMYCCHKPYQIAGHILDEDILEKKAQADTDMSMCDIPCRMTAPNMFVAQTMKERKDPYFI
jgi:MoaA/NifB/PqqE/SkfB family radical SAM enzyme